ncbi:MAG: hypothetical protein FD170_2891 [Bacteroidetes bacterium]|nr:MAG: hypothetical protein FD170_2891 [Bacteroidota bacterium]
MNTKFQFYKKKSNLLYKIFNQITDVLNKKISIIFPRSHRISEQMYNIKINLQKKMLISFKLLKIFSKT